MESKLIVIAIGGNSLIEDPKKVTVDAQYRAAEKTAHHIANIIQEGHRVVIVHGNGPQVGYILLRSEYARKILHSVPLDSCVADTQGAIGYQLQKALDNEFLIRKMENKAVTVVTQVEAWQEVRLVYLLASLAAALVHVVVNFQVDVVVFKAEVGDEL